MKHPEIASRFSYILNKRGLKAKDLADKTGISKSSISQYVNGSHCPSNDTAIALGEVLRVDPLWLMGFEVEMESSVKNDQKERTDKFIQLYERLDAHQQKLVDDLLENLSSNK